MFNKILIANRGEIACRIIKTAKKLNIGTVAIYSEIDLNALHVQLADESYCVGAAPSIASYLNREKIIAIAQLAQAEAIHPGYGFLSEDDEFAEKCQQAGLIFIGPSPQAIRMMGDKTLAKTTMVAAGVPVVPGYDGDTTDFDALKKAAQKIGLPILVKASAGGGGKGMRLVENLDQLKEAVQGAMREAQASFGDSRVFLERYLARSRHIEVQILFDQHGHGVHLFDRDCSVQRRHQKVIEEAPAPGLKESTRQKMAQTALRAGEAINYCSTGTIEFLVDENENFYFMEMNTRLQVEHPVTEMITGLDLVEWQLRIAAGEKLTLKQADIKARGHAIEARLYAENPQKNFMPSAGRLEFFALPQVLSANNRVDTGFRTGDKVSIYYDPLLAKIIAWGENRLTAIQNLQKLLHEVVAVGIYTNWSFINRIISNPAFIQEKITTHFIAEQQSLLLTASPNPPDFVLAIACLAILKQQQANLLLQKDNNEDALSPWFIADGWRLNQAAQHIVSFWQHDKNWQIPVAGYAETWQADWRDDNYLTVTLGDEKIAAIVFNQDNDIHIFCAGEQWLFSQLNPTISAATTQTGHGLKAPMPGTVIQIDVQPGQTVTAGQRLLVMEAMKMEHSLLAPQSGVIQTIHCQSGSQVNEGVQLITFASTAPV